MKNLITGYDELMSFATSQDVAQRELWYLFSETTDAELKKMFFELKCHLPGYCYNPEVKAEFKRRVSYFSRQLNLK